MKFNKVILATIVVWIVSTIYTWLTCGWLFKWIYNIEPTALWKSQDMMMGGNAVFGSLFVSLIVAFIFVYVFGTLFKGIPGKGLNKGFSYGFLVWLVGGFSSMLAMPYYMNIANTAVFYLIASSLVLSLINGAVTAKMYK